MNKFQFFCGLFFCFLLLLVGCKNTKNEKTLTIWMNENDVNADAKFKELIDKFKNSHPDVLINYQTIAIGDLSSKLIPVLGTKNAPDILHVQPYMAYSLYKKGYLSAIDDVVDSLDKDQIFSEILDAQKYDGKYYGIGYALGTTFFSYRKDWEAGLDSNNVTWDQFYTSALNIAKNNNSSPFTIPGNNSFFTDQLLCLLVASNGGRLFDDQQNPTLDSKEVIEALKYLKSISHKLNSSWKTESYTNAFSLLGQGKVATLPITYGRSSVNINEVDPDANDGKYGAISTPIGPSGRISYVNIDAEAFTIMNHSTVKDLAKSFILEFYKKDFYLEYCKTVPVHLIPIFKNLAVSDSYLNYTENQKWKSWIDLSIKKIQNNEVLPILMTHKNDKNIPFFFELSHSKILTELFTDVVIKDIQPEVAAKNAQEKLKSQIKKWSY